MEIEKINQIYDELNEEQKTEYLIQFNKRKKNFVLVFSTLISLFVITFAIAIISNISSPLDEIVIICVVFAIYIFLLLFCIIYNVRQLKLSEEEKIKKQI